MKIIADCYNAENIAEYKRCGVDRLILASPLVSVRPVRVYEKEEIIQIIEAAHNDQLEVGLNMLNFMTEEQIELFREMLQLAKTYQVDAIYFTDMGVFQLADDLDIKEKMVYQPSTLITNSADAEAYLDLGIQNVVLSREITLTDLKRILEKCPYSETVVFGYNPMMHSRRKLLSSYFEFTYMEDKSNAENLFLMEETRSEKMPVFQDESGTYVLSGSLFCMFREMAELNLRNMRIECRGIDEALMMRVVGDIRKMLADEKDGNELYEQYAQEYPSFNISDGFMHKKTSLVKESL